MCVCRVMADGDRLLCVARFPFLDVNPEPSESVLDMANAGRFDEIQALPQFADFALNVHELRFVYPQRMAEGPMKTAFWLNVFNLLVCVGAGSFHTGSFVC